jgi:hypothetical protein
LCHGGAVQIEFLGKVAGDEAAARQEAQRRKR